MTVTRWPTTMDMRGLSNVCSLSRVWGLGCRAWAAREKQAPLAQGEEQGADRGRDTWQVVAEAAALHWPARGGFQVGRQLSELLGGAPLGDEAS